MAYVSLFTFCGFNIMQPLESDFRVELSHSSPSPTGACDVFMNSCDAHMLGVLWQACLNFLIFPPPSFWQHFSHTCCSYMFNVRICCQKAGTKTDRYIKIEEVCNIKDLYRGICIMVIDFYPTGKTSWFFMRKWFNFIFVSGLVLHDMSAMIGLLSCPSKGYLNTEKYAVVYAYIYVYFFYSIFFMFLFFYLFFHTYLYFLYSLFLSYFFFPCYILLFIICMYICM